MTANQVYKIMDVMLNEMSPVERDSFMQLIQIKKIEENQLCVGNTKINSKIKKERAVHDYMLKVAEKESIKRNNKKV